MSPYRLLVLDLDGTTLTSASTLTEPDVAAAHALTAAGIDVTIATGRLFTGTQWVAKALGIDGSVAVMNGSELVDAASGRTTHGRYLHRDSCHHARKHLSEAGLSTFVFGSRAIHLDARDEQHTGYLGIWTEALERHVDIFSAPAWDTDDVVAVCAVGEAHQIDAARQGLHETLHDDLGTEVFRTFSGQSFLAVRHHGEDKGTALQRLATERGTTAAHTVAVGDWINDVPMLRAAGRSFVMGNAMDHVTAEADEVLDAKVAQGGAIVEVARRVWGIQA